MLTAFFCLHIPASTIANPAFMKMTRIVATSNQRLFAKNAAEDSSIDPFIGSWISTLIIAPVAIILTRRASSDKGFINFDFALLILTKFINPFKKFKKNE